MDTLAITAVTGAITAVLYLVIGRTIWRRPVSTEARLARDMFALWWALLGGLSIVGSLQVALYLGGHLPVWLYQTFGQVALLILFGALWALQVYLVYLYTGSRRWFAPLAGAYLAMYLGIIALLHWVGAPEQILDNGWRLQVQPEVRLSQGATVVFLLLLVGPAMAAAIGYASLFRKTRDPTQRYRIALLTGSILVWFGTSLLVGATSDPDDVNVVWEVASRLLGIAAALTILMAYKPPAWVQRRLGVGSLANASNAPDPPSK